MEWQSAPANYSGFFWLVCSTGSVFRGSRGARVAMKMVKMIVPALAGLVLSVSAQAASTMPAPNADTRLPAIKLINTADNHSAFVVGSVPSLDKIQAQNFWFSNTFEPWQKGVHPAPRKQYVVSMKGRLKFKVSDGSTFILEPGTVLLAEDTEGEGHSWEIIDGNEWVRMYIPMTGDDDHFTAQ
jgi:hypothetical protein